MTALKEINTTLKKHIPLNLFFIELLIVMMFFAVSGGVIMNLFGSADVRSRTNRITEQAMLKVQSISEAYAFCGDLEEAADTVFGHSACVECTKKTDIEDEEGNTLKELTLNGFTVTYDENMYPLVTSDGRRDYGVVEIRIFERRDEAEFGSLNKIEITAMLLTGRGGADVFYEGVSSAYIPDYEAAARAEAKAAKAAAEAAEAAGAEGGAEV